MADTNLIDIYPYVMPELPKCPKGMVLQAFRFVLREFLHRSQVYEYDLEAIDIVDGTTEYAIASPLANTDIDAVVEVKHQSRVLNPMREWTVPFAKDVVILVNEPSEDVTDGLEIKVCLITLLTADTIAPRLFTDWVDDWAAGVKARLMIQPKKAWTNPQLAAEYHRQYWSGIRQATNIRIKQGTPATIIMHPLITV